MALVGKDDVKISEFINFSAADKLMNSEILTSSLTTNAIYSKNNVWNNLLAHKYLTNAL